MIRQSFFILMFLSVWTSSLLAQDNSDNEPVKIQHTKETSLFFGYNFSPSNGELSNYNSIEVSLIKSGFSQYRHVAGTSFYLTQEVGVASDILVHGTKAGINVFALGILFGAELTYHTDYKTQAFAFSPYIGLGGPSHRLTFSWRGRLAENEFQALSPLNLNISTRIFKLK